MFRQCFDGLIDKCHASSESGREYLDQVGCVKVSK